MNGLLKQWYRQPAAPSLLQPLSWIYGAVVAGRNAAYAHGWMQSRRVGRPVVVVGNLTVGGTGKTPLTIWLAQELTRRGLEVGLVSRGYARRERAARALGPHATWEEAGDEPLLLARRTGCPTVVARDRVLGAKMLVDHPVQVIIADDGLQHLRLARDCEIIVVDGARGFGNGRMLPAGPLRESVRRLYCADAIVVNGPAEHESARRLFTDPALRPLQMSLIQGEAQRLDGSQERRRLEDFRGQPVHAVAAIGNPERFFRDLRARGLELIEHPFADHHALTAAELEFGDRLPVLMTEKDAVKCGGLAHPSRWYVPVAAAFGEADSRRLIELVTRKLESFIPARG